ncbi:Ig-like domain-containing protein [Paenibacillus fonticola]|uniref:Ig-like domain-containing protein n=1 Tax=Paenibacillus fonticola TaxID=379896 RepID=UPI000382BEDD|nr:Ig-like domain-containing protein [Paenibacillus fonticola]
MKATKWLKQMLVGVLLFTSFPGVAVYAEESQESAKPPNSLQPSAFPGAEGGGKYTTGGRGGEIYEVTTLADSGPGSLREAVSAGNRTVVFRVGGIIQLESPLKIIGDNLTIAGQTAPGDGITVIGYPTTFEGNNLIVRYMRFRLGDANVTEADSFGGRYKKDIIIDHCSFSWSVDEVLSPYGNENVTVQWSIIADAMHISKHAKGRHGYGGIWGGKNTSFHHNLIANNSSRNPAFDSTAGNSHDFRNNVIYNWGFFASYGGKGAVTNMINNYYKPGPETEVIRFMNAETTGSYYIAGNVMDGYPDFTEDNWSGVHKYPDYVKLDSPISFANPLPTESAEQAYEAVMQNAGATLPKRDAIDARIINNVIHRTGTHINSQTEVGGYPLIEQVNSLFEDDDHDGMPNSWELAQGLDPNDPSDRNVINAEGYTNLELYLNSIQGNGSVNPSVTITLPANNAVIESGSTVMFHTDVSDKDGTVTKVEFYRNGEKVGEDKSKPFHFKWKDAANGTHYWVAKAIDDSGTSAFSTNVVIHVNTRGSITPWKAADVGNPGIPGHTELGESPDELIIKSAGDIGGTKDAFHFAYQEITGDAAIVAKVESVTATNEEAEAGLMFRNSLKEDSPFVSLLVPYIRTGKRGVTLSRAEEGGEVSRIQPDQEFQLPYWIKLVRRDNQFTSFISPDGIDWIPVGTVDVDLSEKVYVGLVADAAKVNNEVEKYNTSRFSNVQITNRADFNP